MAIESEKKPFRMWVMHCPFKKDGFPSLGSFGKDIKPVVIITMDEWNRLNESIPELAKTMFEVGSYD